MSFCQLEIGRERPALRVAMSAARLEPIDDENAIGKDEHGTAVENRVVEAHVAGVLRDHQSFREVGTDQARGGM
jgi:hypothetical protein